MKNKGGITVVDAILTIIFALIIMIGSALVTVLNLLCKDEIWEAIYKMIELD